MIGPILPGSTLGIIGGGQLGRMLAQAAQAMGYHIYVLDPDPDAPACRVTDRRIIGRYDDERAVALLRQSCDAITYEFENVKPEPLIRLREEGYVLHPNPAALHVGRNRSREKRFALECGFDCAPFRDGLTLDGTESDMAVVHALRETGPAILKTEEGGYDGKGQVTLDPAESDADLYAKLQSFRENVEDSGLKAMSEHGQLPVFLEARVVFAKEFSLIAARFADGSFRAYPPLVNTHRNGILHSTVTSMPLPEAALDRAMGSMRRLLSKLDYFGVLAVEFFLTADGEILFNEMAPRPHNSGHLTIEASAVSQFEQHIRSICGLPPGEPDVLRPAAMLNLVAPFTAVERLAPAVLALPDTHLHLYAKKAAKPGRKMGHITVLADSLVEVQQRLTDLERIACGASS